MSINVLGLAKGESHKYELGMDGSANITGSIMCIMDERFKEGTSATDAWQKILDAGGKNDGITYIINVIKSGKQWAYVGKTLGTFKSRYTNGPTGGLLQVFKFYDPKDILDCTLYNVSHPALMEGWCYQVLAAKKYNVTNVQDPC
ncbi:hypothetical protein TSA1_35175 [Bradyrhizobium nitroreducens]|uniref:Uncharacterized protein n=1 Tax=Bradyrhizobium nitroreducens TaxID=709803 RepID=A0A2M6ULA0_9BRAD|nr:MULTISPECIES: hypothetical protein [Bradyrhizobium]PIT05402.1 hypothetical protein TSA1_35175 [Bradyrhizobium nitroreducens]TQF40626.1 hypothetical protein UNPF46_09865 [Bradyrhizobium sp. UNPF46]